METRTKAKLAWKYRKQLWRYRNVIRHRKDIAGVLLTGAAIGAAAFVRSRE